MALPKNKQANKHNKKASANAGQMPNRRDANRISPQLPRTLADIQNDPQIRYKILVLIYDLRNMTKDKTSENRTLQTIDPLYISAPYFSDEEADAVKNTTTADGTSVEQAITRSLENFFSKRRASGDCRPCGPHDMVPVYLSVFGIDKTAIEDEKFVSRLRRSGLSSS